VSTILVVVVTAQVALDTSYWTVFNHITIWGSVLVFFIFHYVYNFAIGGRYLGSLTKASYSYFIAIFFNELVGRDFNIRNSPYRHCKKQAFGLH